MKAFVNDAVGLHLLSRYPYKNKDDLVAALNSADPHGAARERQRLEYYMKKIRGKMLEEQRRPKQRRPAEGPPSDTNVTEGFSVGTSADNALKMEIFDSEPPAAVAAEEPPPPPNPLGGRRRIRSATTLRRQEACGGRGGAASRFSPKPRWLAGAQAAVAAAAAAAP
jgi:hypothetical protein